MKATNSVWFTPMGMANTIGIVIGKDETTGEEKAYIGLSGFANTEKDDEKLILKGGAKFPIGIAKQFFTK